MTNLTAFKIEKGVLLPTESLRGAPKYPWSQLEVGDSFFVKGGNLNVISSSARLWGKRNNGARFTTRTVDGGVRVWRVA